MFFLVFCGTGAIVINQECGGSITHLGVAVSFGLVVMIMIYSFGKISGAHINPAVTVSFYVAKLFDKKLLLGYLLFQILGGICASLLLHFLFPSNQNLGGTYPAGSEIQSFVLEFILTFLLMYVILAVSQAEQEIKQFTGFIVGLVVLLEALFAGPVCGASMNPARSIAPALVSGNFLSLWIYVISPILGAVSSVFVWNYFCKE